MRAVSVGDEVRMQADYLVASEGGVFIEPGKGGNEVRFIFECLSIEDNYSTWSIRYTLWRSSRIAQRGQTSVSFDHQHYTTLGLLRLALEALEEGVFKDDANDPGGMARGQHEAHDALPQAAQHSEPDH